MNRIALLAIGIAALLPAAARGQGFGQNKVQWKDLRWVTITTEHFEVYYYEGTDEAALDAARMAERAYTRLSTILNHQVGRRIPLVLYASHGDFQTTNIIPNIIGEGTGGFTEHAKRRVVIPFTGGYGDLDHVLTHELVHAFQVDILYGRGGGGIAGPLGGGYTPPLWFMEGMSEYLSVTEVDNLTDMWLRDAALQGYLTPLGILDYVQDIRVYRFGQAIFAYIGRTFGDDRIGELMKRVARVRSVERAVQDVLGMTLEKLSDDWTEDVRRNYLPQIRDHSKAEEVARRLTDSREELSSFHLAPALSPDGGKMVFIADRSLYNDLYLASALDGRVEERLVKGDRTEQFETLRFLNASFDFDPKGERIVFAARAGREDAIYIQRTRDREILSRFSVPVDGIANPAFSPDGEWIVFVGLDGGRSDLWRIRTDGKDLERLTDDRFLALSPRYSPDGGRIAFVTDEAPETDFENLAFADPKIAILDVETRARTVLPDMPGTNTAPHFFPDGKHLLYVSDRTGIANLYIRDLERNQDARITDLLTGATGVVPLAPAVSLSRDGRRAVFSSFRAGSWDLFALKDPLSLADWSVSPIDAAAEPDSVDAEAGGEVAHSATAAGIDGIEGLAQRPALPPLAPLATLDSLLAGGDSIFDALEPPAAVLSARERREAPPAPPGEEKLEVKEVFRKHSDLPDTTGFRFDRYRVKLSADYATANGFFASNVGAAAQTVILFSDILGNHNLLIGASVYGSISDSDLIAQYTNQANRINYGIALYQYRDDFYLSTARDDEEYVSQIYRGAQVGLYWPLSRFRRLELSLEGLGVDEEVYRQAYTGFGYYDYERTERNRLYFMRPGFAIVTDNTLWGSTGPISGGRSRVYVDASFGDIQSSRWVLDHRRYLNMRQRYAMAMRAVGASSHGRDPQLFRIGGPYTLRGLDYGALEGTNAGFLNLEFRFPLIEALELGWPLPLGLRGVRGAIFFDTGAAWSENDRFRATSHQGGWHLADLKAAYGIGASINVGFTALRWDLARRTDLQRNLGAWQGSISFGGDF